MQRNSHSAKETKDESAQQRIFELAKPKPKMPKTMRARCCRNGKASAKLAAANAMRESEGASYTQMSEQIGAGCNPMRLDRWNLALQILLLQNSRRRPSSASRLMARVQRVCCVQMLSKSRVGGERRCRGGRAGGLVEVSKVALGGAKVAFFFFFFFFFTRAIMLRLLVKGGGQLSTETSWRRVLDTPYEVPALRIVEYRTKYYLGR
ncbi:hypothetical protein V8C37DRAFT_99235 [Trichoderma ceciliae]